MIKNPTNEQLETVVRQQAAEGNSARLAELVKQVDALRTQGKKAEFRINAQRQSIYVVTIEEVAVDLNDVEEALDETADA